MADNWKINKWMDEMTPRRAIQNFFDHATPMDSPDPEELVKPHNEMGDGTPLASQSSQPGGTLKRKIVRQQEGSESANRSPKEFEAKESAEDSSILGLSELPSQLASPSLDPIPRPKTSNRKRVSTTTFSQVIQSQESQPSRFDESESINDLSIPSNLDSPDMVLSQRPAKKSRVSISAFSKTLESQKVVGGLASKSAAGESSSDSIPLSLDSPVKKNKAGPKSSKKRISSLSLPEAEQSKTAHVNETIRSSPADPTSVNNTIIPDALDSPADLPRNVRPMNKQRKRMSTTVFSQIIEERTNPVTKTHSKKVEEFTKESPPASETRISGFVVEKYTIDSSPRRRTSGRIRSRSFNSNKDLPEQDAPKEQPSLDIEQIESPEERSTRQERSVDIVQEESPSPKQIIEETIIKSSQVKRTPSREVALKPVEQRVSFSDEDIDIRTDASGIVEFTAREIQQPSASEITNTEVIPQIIVTNPKEPEDVKELSFTTDTSIVFKRSYARPAEKSTEDIEYTVGIPDIESPEDFSPVASSTQLIKRKPLSVADRTVIEDLLIENQRTVGKRNLSATPANAENMSESDIPSKLSSPEEMKRDRSRTGPVSHKKRVSMTDFLAALNQKSVPPPTLETPQKPIPVPQASSKRVAAVVEEQHLEVESLEEVKVPQRRPSVTSTASSATVPLEQGSSARNSNEENDELRLESESESNLVLLPSETNKTNQTLASLGRSRRSLIFDSIETSVESTRAEDSPLASPQATSPASEPADELAAEKSRLAQGNKTIDGLSSETRSRKSLRFDSPVTVQDITPAQDDLTTPTSRRSREEIVEETPSAENVEQGADLPEMPEEESDRRGFTEEQLSSSSRKSEKLSPFNRYPGLKNSTVLAGGAPFVDVSPLSMSPIVPSDKESPANGLTTPVTPAASTKKPSRPIAHSPMYLSVMQKAFKKQEAQRLSSQSLLQKTPVTSKSIDNSLRKGMSPANERKGKSVGLPTVSEDRENIEDESEDDEVMSNVSIKPRAIELALKNRDGIPDRSKDYVPLEKRLKQDAAFQAKVNFQKAKIEAAKTAELAATAGTRAPRKERAATSKKTTDNITNVATNKGNVRFYSKFKVAKDALEVAHDVVSEWLDFTLDQMETFCDEEGVALDTWEDCYKMLKRQNIVKSKAEYQGFCHDLLLHDESQDLLPSEFPPGHYESKRQAKRRRME